MFASNNRYDGVKTKTLTTDKGKVIPYKGRRFLPKLDYLSSETHITVREGDRLDTIATSLFGDPFLAWRLCDVNEAMHPADLTNTPGCILRSVPSQLVPEEKM